MKSTPFWDSEWMTLNPEPSQFWGYVLIGNVELNRSSLLDPAVFVSKPLPAG